MVLVQDVWHMCDQFRNIVATGADLTYQFGNTYVDEDRLAYGRKQEKEWRGVEK